MSHVLREQRVAVVALVNEGVCMSNQKGFTLLELLIAAALIGVLAMFATQAYRASASDIRIADAKARALLMEMAARRYYLEYPNANVNSFSKNEDNQMMIPMLQSPDRNAEDAVCNMTNPNVQDLVDCGFLEYRQAVVDNKNAEGQGSGSVDMWFTSAGPDNVTVCFKGKGRVTDKNTYCTTSDGSFQKIPPQD